MSEHVLFSLENCVKCAVAEDYLREAGIDFIKVKLPKNASEWGNAQKKLVESYNVLEDLKRTAPIMVLSDSTKLIGMLRIKQWIENR